MADVVYNIPELAVFANSAKFSPLLPVLLNKLMSTRIPDEYEILLKQATQEALGYQNIEIPDRKDYGRSSFFTSRPLFQPLLLKGKSGLEDLLLESAIIDIDQTRNIVSTSVQGRDTTIDEFINNGDIQVSCSGILCNRLPEWPRELFQRFWEFTQLKSSIEIEHEVLNSIGIYEIVILSIKAAKTPHINCQPYQFTAKSTQPVSLKIGDLPASNQPI